MIPKFRATSTLTEEKMVQRGIKHKGRFVFGAYNDGYIIDGTFDSTDEFYQPVHWCHVDPKTVEQWTGLKDKSGKDIYEGDIIRIRETLDNGRLVCLETTTMIYFDDSTASYQCSGGFNGSPSDYFEGSPLTYYGNIGVVIGNIHENPELLEVGK